MASDKRLNGKVMIITGSGSGFGRAGAIRFAAEGAKVVVADINMAGAEETVRLIQQAGGEAIAVKCNVAKAEDVQAMVEAATAAYGRLDGIWNNAGIQGETAQDIAHCPVDMIDRYVDIDIKGVWYGCHYAAPEIVRTSWSRRRV